MTTQISSRRKNRKLVMSLRNLAASTSGAIDLASIMVGVIIIGIIAGTITASVFGVIPWSQDAAAKQTVQNVQTAQAVARVKEGKFLDTAGLVAGGYLPAKALADGGLDIHAGRGASLRAAADTVAPNTPKVTTDSAGSCYVAAVQSATGKTFYTTNASSYVVTAGVYTPDTTFCATFPIKLQDPVLADSTWKGTSSPTWGVTYNVNVDDVGNKSPAFTGGTWSGSAPNVVCDQGATWTSSSFELSTDGSTWNVLATGTGATLANPLVPAVTNATANAWDGKNVSLRYGATCTKPGFADKTTYFPFGNMTFSKNNVPPAPSITRTAAGSIHTYKIASGWACPAGAYAQVASISTTVYRGTAWQGVYGSSTFDSSAKTLYTVDDSIWNSGDKFYTTANMECYKSVNVRDGSAYRTFAVTYKSTVPVDIYVKP